MSGKHWSGPTASRAVDLYDAKADMFSALESCGLATPTLQITKDAPSYFHPGRSGAVRLGPNNIAYFGEIHPAILQEMKIDDAVVGFELFLESVPAQKKKTTTNLPLVSLPPFQPVTRDFAFVVNDRTEGDILIKTIKLVDRDLIERVEIFDIYKGTGVAEGQKSVALSVTLQPKVKTLTDDEIEALAQKIVKAIEEKTGAKLR
jgi:phenylalanyl-tRNA synthetase beta chain